ncbi:MAG: DUF664 domain-containing protein [Nocardioidaceae bacterium]|nr:DUF664 domain-containing protein [Nocardioidaceae bacterium]NUS49727.1 DUF664 domain-containing protein [Nocardioidaceae bacterium]
MTTSWTAPAVDRPDGDETGDERSVLCGYLGFHRATLLHKCAGLDGAQLATRAVPPSSMSLLGLLRHMAKVERIWFPIRFAGQDLPRLFPEPDSDFDEVDPTRAEEDYALLLDEQRRADEVIASVSFDDTFEHDGETINARVLMQHLMHEYARHNGHADLLRECVDGATGV